MESSNAVQQRSAMPQTLSRSDAEPLSEKLTGDWYLPGDSHYQEAKKAWALSVKHEPAIIVEVKNSDDVVAAITFANQHNLLVAVQSTGHGAMGPCNGHMLLRTSKMHQFSIDVEQQTVTTQAGAQWDDIINAAGQLGLAPLTGFVSNVGVTGFTLGGGFGWLVRKYGLALDHLLSVDLVTLNGEFITASATEHSDLFWGLGGGVGNFGVVTTLTMKLVPVKEVLASQFYYPADKARQVLEVYQTTAASFPEELTSTVSLMHLPPAPTLPPAIQGQFVIAVKAIYLGDDDQGAQLLSPFSQLESIYQKHERIAYSDAGKLGGEPEKPQESYGHVELLRKFDPDLIRILQDLAVGTDSVKPVIEIRHVAGAMSRVPAEKNAFGHRDVHFILHVEIPLGEAATHNAAKAYMQYLSEAMEPYASGGTYLNFIGNVDAGEAQVEAAFSADHYAKLQGLKRRYDPENILRFTFNIPPAHS